MRNWEKEQRKGAFELKKKKKKKSGFKYHWICVYNGCWPDVQEDNECGRWQVLAASLQLYLILHAFNIEQKNDTFRCNLQGPKGIVLSNILKEI